MFTLHFGCEYRVCGQEVNNVDTTAAIAWHQHNPPQLVEHVTTWGDDTVNISRDSNARGQMEEQLVRRKKSSHA